MSHHRASLKISALIFEALQHIHAFENRIGEKLLPYRYLAPIVYPWTQMQQYTTVPRCFGDQFQASSCSILPIGFDRICDWKAKVRQREYSNTGKISTECNIACV